MQLSNLFLLNEQALFWLIIASLITFVLTLVAVPLLAARIPANYFCYKSRHRTPWDEQHPLMRWTLLIAKNILGFIFLAVGTAMLFLPGQGLLTIFIGVMLLNFPGKYRFERWLVSRRPILHSINWLRHKAHRPPLSL